MMSLGEASAAIGASAAGGKARFSSVSTDTRTLAPGALFVALRGERFDGHRFLPAARARGAAAAMVDEASESTPEAAGLPLLIVGDTRLGLGRLAAQWRARFDIPLIAVTGSNGKTTVKEMIAAILRAHFGDAQTLATEGNFNNDVGLPLTVLRLRAPHRAAVIEIGMNHPGETAALAAIASPTVALVNNAQREHQEFMKDVAAVAHEHAAAFEALRPGGVAVINADDEFAGYWRSLLSGRRVRDFGVEHPAEVSAHYEPANLGSRVELRASEGAVAFELHASGRHNVLNACAAAAGALAAGASLDAVAKGLSAFRPVAGRMQRLIARSGAGLIDDSYNANPDSVRAAIDVLAAEPGRKLLLLGDMGEVGERAAEFHAEIGRYAREGGIDSVYAVGEQSRAAVEAFGPGARHFASIDDLIAAATEDVAAQTSALVKGSRFMRMERVVQALATEPTKGH